MNDNSIALMERQVVNIADGRCLGNLKDIELNLWTGSIEALILPALHGFWHRLQHTGELSISWDKVVRVGVDVILVDAPELCEQDCLFSKGKRKRTPQIYDDAPLWQQEVAAYQEESTDQNIILLNKGDYREV